MTNSEYRRMMGPLPGGEYRLSERAAERPRAELQFEDKPNASDYEQDAWIEITDGSQLCAIMRGWAERH